MSQRFSAQTIIDAFKATGLRPKQGKIRSENGECCALGALAVQHGLQGTSYQLYEWADRKYGEENSRAIQYGFDGSGPLTRYACSPYYKSARKAAKMLGLK